MRRREQMTKAESCARQHGFSIIELMVVVAVLAVVASWAVMGITSARAAMRVNAASREYAGYLEKARLDAMRRHDTASVQIIDNTTYRVTLDFDLDGTIEAGETRTITLPEGVLMTGIAPMTLSFDWRGRTTSTLTSGGAVTKNANITAVFSNDAASINVDVTGSGDITYGALNYEDDIPDVVIAALGGGGSTPEYAPTPPPTPTPMPTPTPPSGEEPTPDTPDTQPTPVTQPTPETKPTPDTQPTPVTQPTPDTQPTPVTQPTPDTQPTPVTQPTPGSGGGGGTPCSLSATPSSLTIKKRDSGSVTLTLAGGTISNIAVEQGSNLTVTGSGSSYTIQTTNTRGNFKVTFTSSCGKSTTVSVNVVN